MSRLDRKPVEGQFLKPDRRNVSLATYLEQVAVLLISAVDSGSRTTLEKVMNDYFASCLQSFGHIIPGVGTIYASDREAFIDNVTAYVAAYNFRIRSHNVTASIDEANGIAQVFATVTASGTAEASQWIRNEGVLVYYFERQAKQGNVDDEWIVERLEFVRGPGSY